MHFKPNFNGGLLPPHLHHFSFAHPPPLLLRVVISLHFLSLPFTMATASQQCNLGLKLFSIESGNAICASLAPFQCIELCEWADADKGGCSLSSHYTAFRGRRTYLTGMVLTENSFLVQCCASLATSVLLDAEHEPICRWSEQIETVIDKPSVRFDTPLGDQEYFRDLRGTRTGRGGAKMQAEICRFVVQRTNCDRMRMTPEEAHQYSLLLLRLQRTRDFFQNGHNGIVNAGDSLRSDEPERARAEHRRIYKNTTKVGQLELLHHRDSEDASEKILKATANALENGRQSSPTLSATVEGGNGDDGRNKVQQHHRMLVDGMSGGNDKQADMDRAASKQPAERVIYNDRRRPAHQQLTHNDPSNQTSTLPPQVEEVPPSRPILPDDPSREQQSQVARGVRELFFRAAKQGKALLKKLNRPKNFNATLGPRRPSGGGPNGHRHRHHHSRQKEAPVRMQMSKLGWPKGLRRRLWPVLATNTTRELIPTRTNLNWVDNEEFFDGIPAGHNDGISGTVRVLDGDGTAFDGGEWQNVRMDRIRPLPRRQLEEDTDQPVIRNAERRVRIRKLRKNVVNGGTSSDEEKMMEEEAKVDWGNAPREALIASAGNELAAGGGGSFEPEVPPMQQQILPFHAIKEISTSPLGRAPAFRNVPFVEKKQQQMFVQKWSPSRREGQVGPGAKNGNAGGSQLGMLLECCQEQAPGCRTLCTRDVSKEQIKRAMSSGQCPPLSMTSVLQCFPRFYNISSVSQCCAAGGERAPPNLFGQVQTGLPPQCQNLCAADFHLSFAHLACVEHSELILSCYRQLLDQIEGGGMRHLGNEAAGEEEEEDGKQRAEIVANEKMMPFSAIKRRRRK